MTQPGTLTIDGRSVPFKAGQTIMAAAAAAGVYIPHLCHHPDYPPHGSCKLCTVKVDGHAHAACTLPAHDGAVVENDTPALQADRRRLVQMLFIEGNHLCPSCERSGNCQLQAVAYFVGMTDTYFPHAYPRREMDASHPDVLLDHDRCIQCALCVRASEAEGKHVFALAGRGADTTVIVDSPSGKLGDSTLTVHDRAAHVCPVGAIVVKRIGFRDPIGQRLYDRHTIAEVGNRHPNDYPEST